MKKSGAMAGASTTTTVARPERRSSRCWRDLPKDIIDSVLGRLTLLADYDRFGAVCTTWRRASLDPINRSRRIESSLSSSSFPLLIFPPDATPQEGEGDSWKFRFIDIFRRNTIVKDLISPRILEDGDVLYAAIFCGSSHGWLIFQGTDQLTLINPFYTREGGSICRGGMIRLPPLPYDKHYRIGKVVLSADPALSPNDYMAFALYGADNEVLFIKPDDNEYKEWTSIESGYLFIQAEDVVFHNGIVYASDQKGGLYICDNLLESIPSFDLLCVAPPRPTTPHEPFYNWYIVPSPDDEEIFLVYMSKLFRFQDFQTRQFRVYKLLLSPGGGPATWLEMKNKLGNDDSKAIILGGNHSFCINIKTCPPHCGFHPNSIYFLNDESSYGRLYGDPSSQDVGIFNLKDRSIRKCYERSDLREQCLIRQPAWLVPSLPGNWRKQVP